MSNKQFGLLAMLVLMAPHIPHRVAGGIVGLALIILACWLIGYAIDQVWCRK